MTDRLEALYRKLAARGESPEAETVVRLAAGERDDDALARVAASRAGADALALALASGDDAHALAREFWRDAAAARRRPRAVPMPWLAAAAAIATGFALMLKLSAPVAPDVAPVAATPDVINGGSFEEVAVVTSDSFESARDDAILTDDFDA